MYNCIINDCIRSESCLRKGLTPCSSVYLKQGSGGVAFQKIYVVKFCTAKFLIDA